MPGKLTSTPRGERDWFDRGPLGSTNYRNQLGRSSELGDPVSIGAATLIFTGATQKTQRGREGLALRAAGDSAASLTQVTCTYQPHTAGEGTRPLTVRGKIDWGTDGHQASAVFDWVNGTVIQVASSYVRIVAEIADVMATADEVPSHDVDAVVTVGALIGYWGANRPPPTFTQQLRMVQDDAPALPTASIAIPRFARRLWWTGPTPTSVVWALGPGAGQTLAQVDPAGVTPRQPYERPGIASFLQVIGNAGGPTLNNLVWELVL